ncbi:MAG: Glutamyl-tRNA(Gln) amidotransferase subunit A [Candidatus Heimdallarchaeota archaeon LC_3]|nr:MAG: Glutamyl-tRNA(Gln) amidotransferase subunit A [Candidatus Heimdallarchaeota archaeon LC_3]
MKQVELWSILDYKNFIYHNESDLFEIFGHKFQEINRDKFNIFISRKFDFVHSSKEKRGSLFNIPISIKDNLCTKGILTTCASKMLKDWIPSYDASVVTFLKEEQALIIGKTNLDEFAMGNTTETSYFGPTYNPWDSQMRFSPGGSSGGAAVSVALGYVPVAIASDTGGSIRCPASWTGVLGLKPTYGRVSRFGLVSYSHTLDQIGILSRYAEDQSKILEIISRPDPKDMTYENQQFHHESLELTEEISVGILPDFFTLISPMQQEIYSEIIKIFDNHPQIQIEEINIPDWEILLPTYYTIASGEAYSNLSRYTGEQYGYSDGDPDLTRLHGFGKEVLKRIQIGKYSLKQGYDEQLYVKAQNIRQHFKLFFKSIFHKTTIIALPTMLDVAPTWDELKKPLESYQADLLTVPANLLGIPAISIPVGFVKKQGVKLPLGLQLYASWWNERTLLQIASEIQKVTNFHIQLPPSKRIHEEDTS